MKKKFFYPALLISLLGLAAAKPVQADTSVADIQKERRASCRCKTRRSQFRLQGS